MSHTAERFQTAAGAGSAATDRFRESGKLAGGDVDVARVDLLASRAVKALNDIILEERVTYDEFNALKAWLIKVGEDGEWPLFLDVWLEHSVEEVATEHREGNKGSIEGPYYVPDAPTSNSPMTMPMRDDESGTPFAFTGQLRSTDGTPLAGGKIEFWQADSEGLYSQFAEGVPEWNLRGICVTDDEGNFHINTIEPAPYQIPTEGACGQLISAAGWHAWRPAHFHLKAAADGHELLTAQLYFPGDEHNDDDIASAVKPELMLDVETLPDGTKTTSYDIVLDPVRE